MTRYIVFTGYPGQCKMIGTTKSETTVEKAINALTQRGHHAFAIVMVDGNAWMPYVRKEVRD